MAMDLEENGWQPEDGPKDHLAKQASALLKMKAEMLDDYFSLQVNEESHLLGIPLLLGNYIDAIHVRVITIWKIINLHIV